jgi:hypothetical protein
MELRFRSIRARLAYPFPCNVEAIFHRGAKKERIAGFKCQFFGIAIALAEVITLYA